ncbi:WG repeat-containing protein [Clostridium estertheticum]|uniref:WG repeat-containing protein n=1 Tax=Clostridium estertheticum TaxID=238834 RepID=UPI001CF19886|nr:WG repeat-containing protein [Clostridium estertheticum]MCB2354396.1 WG repeat-containing protein [Clostridium estertheticum]WAG42487.1 WG repeat-containing protein [Clostridium estertheticum]
MDYPLEFITWLEDHDDLCNEQFHSSAIPEYLKGNIEWYPVISFHMGCELYDGDFDTEFNRRLNLLYEMFISGEIKHRLVPNKKTLYGYVDKTGDFVIEPKFDNALTFYNGRAWVSTNNKYGVINKRGDYLIEPLYDAVGSSTENATWVKLNGVWGLLDNNGKFIMQPRYDFDSMECYYEELMSVTIYEKIGFIDTKGNMVIRPRFDGGGFGFSEGLAPISFGGDGPWWGFTDKCGDIVFEGFEDASNFANGLAVVYLNGICGCINSKGDFVIEQRFDSAFGFSDGVMCVGMQQ